jgi:hypothetical protein
MDIATPVFGCFAKRGNGFKRAEIFTSIPQMGIEVPC